MSDFQGFLIPEGPYVSDDDDAHPAAGDYQPVRHHPMPVNVDSLQDHHHRHRHRHRTPYVTMSIPQPPSSDGYRGYRPSQNTYSTQRLRSSYSQMPPPNQMSLPQYPSGTQSQWGSFSQLFADDRSEIASDNSQNVPRNEVPFDHHRRSPVTWPYVRVQTGARSPSTDNRHGRSFSPAPSGFRQQTSVATRPGDYPSALPPPQQLRFGYLQQRSMQPPPQPLSHHSPYGTFSGGRFFNRPRQSGPTRTRRTTRRHFTRQ